MRPPPSGQSIFMRINSMWGERESWVCGEGGWGGVGTRPHFAYNFLWGDGMLEKIYFWILS